MELRRRRLGAPPDHRRAPGAAAGGPPSFWNASFWNAPAVAAPIYVEIAIRAPLEEVWRATQEPALHERWDLRFTRIDSLGATPARRSRSSTRLGSACAWRSAARARRASRAREHPGAARLADPLQVVAEQAAEPAVHRSEQPAADEDPGLGDGVAIRVHDAARLSVADQVGEECVHLAHLVAERSRDHAVLGSLGQRLDPEVDHSQALALRHVAIRDDAEALDRVGRDRLAGLLTEGRPGVAEAGEVEVALRAEVPVENRLGDAGLAGDLGCRSAAVAGAREHGPGGPQDRPGPGPPGEGGPWWA